MYTFCFSLGLMTPLNGMGVTHSLELSFVFQHFLTANPFSTWSDAVETAEWTFEWYGWLTAPLVPLRHYLGESDTNMLFAYLWWSSSRRGARPQLRQIVLQEVAPRAREARYVESVPLRRSS